MWGCEGIMEPMFDRVSFSSAQVEWLSTNSFTSWILPIPSCMPGENFTMLTRVTNLGISEAPNKLNNALNLPLVPKLFQTHYSYHTLRQTDAHCHTFSTRFIPSLPLPLSASLLSFLLCSSPTLAVILSRKLVSILPHPLLPTGVAIWGWNETSENCSNTMNIAHYWHYIWSRAHKNGRLE